MTIVGSPKKSRRTWASASVPRACPRTELGVGDAPAHAVGVVPGDRAFGQEMQEQHLEAQIVPGQQVVDVDVAALERVAVDAPVIAIRRVAEQRLPVDEP